MSNQQPGDDRPHETAADRHPEATPSTSQASAAETFRQQVAAKQSGLDDYDPEDELWSGGYSPKAMIGTWVVITIVSVVILILPWFIEPLTVPMALILVASIWLIAGLRYAWRRLGVHYQLTTQRFIHQTGVLTRHTDRIEVIDIDDVSFSQGPIQRMFDVGTITVTSSDRSHSSLSMVGISGVKDVAGLIDDIRRKERRRRAVHFESI